MLTRRIIFAFSIAVSAATASFADLVELNSTKNQPIDRLEQLTKTLAQGSYQEDEAPAAKVLVTLRNNQKATEINNDVLGKKLVSSEFNKSNPYSWLVTHPLPNSRVSSSYGGRTMSGRAENHSGLDLAAPTGTPIYATGPGIVTKSGWGTGYGQYVEINHGNGYLTRYAHASRLIVSVGDRVNAESFLKVPVAFYYCYNVIANYREDISRTISELVWKSIRRGGASKKTSLNIISLSDSVWVYRIAIIKKQRETNNFFEKKMLTLRLHCIGIRNHNLYLISTLFHFHTPLHKTMTVAISSTIRRKTQSTFII